MALQDDLELEGYEVASASDGLQGLARAREGGFDLIILDVMLPGLDGFEVCRRLRAEGMTTPIIMLTAKSQELDKVLGLELGADDYVTKPFSPRELLARVKAGLRRGKPAPQAVGPCRFGNVEVDLKKYEATKNGAPVDLTTREFDLLRYLIENRDRAVHRFDILEKVWGGHPLGPELLADLEPVQTGQHDVEDDEVEASLLCPRQPLHSVARTGDFVALQPQVILEGHEDALFIFDEQDPIHPRRPLRLCAPPEASSGRCCHGPARFLSPRYRHAPPRSAGRG